jgi:hypothetical protein
MQQTVTIPDSRELRLKFSLPKAVPAGRAKVEIVVIPEARPQAAGRTAARVAEDEQDARRFRESLNAMCLNRSTFENPSLSPLEPLLGMAEGSSFTVEQLLQDRRSDRMAEEKRNSWTTTPLTPVR